MINNFTSHLTKTVLTTVVSSKTLRLTIERKIILMILLKILKIYCQKRMQDLKIKYAAKVPNSNKKYETS